MSWAWVHNDKEHQWELVNIHVVGAVVTDEFIDRVMDLPGAAARLYNRIGTVPPPMMDALPPPDDRVVYRA